MGFETTPIYASDRSTSLVLVISLVAIVYIAGWLAVFDLKPEVLHTLVVKYAVECVAPATQQL